MLAKELKELELNELVMRHVLPTTPVTVTYELMPYSRSLHRVLHELKEWGIRHRQRIVASQKAKRKKNLRNLQKTSAYGTAEFLR